MTTLPADTIPPSDPGAPTNGPPAPRPAALAPPVFPDRLPMVRHLDPAAALAFRTPLQEHVQSADGKAAGILTFLGLMCTVLTRFSWTLGTVLRSGVWTKAACVGLLIVFVGCALGTVVQAFRTIAPKFPKAPPSLAFFGDIARLSREEYLARVMSLSADAALAQMLSYNHTAASICAGKQRQLQFGLRLFRVTAVCWVLLAVVLAFEGLT